MFYYMHRVRLILLGVFVFSGWDHVCAVEISTPSEVEAVNGTDVKLKCTFSSVMPVTAESVTVSWNFRALVPAGPDESVFYYDKHEYPPKDGRFKDRVRWSGDVMKKDASITLLNVPPTFNGTFMCQVRNLPDAHGQSGEIILKVVKKVSISEISILAAVVGGACGLVLVFLAVFVTIRHLIKKRRNNDIELRSNEYKREKSMLV